MHIMYEEWHGEMPLSILIFVAPLAKASTSVLSPELSLLLTKRLPVKTLQLEQMAVVGCAEEPSVVASRMQLVFSTLEVSQLCFVCH